MKHSQSGKKKKFRKSVLWLFGIAFITLTSAFTFLISDRLLSVKKITVDSENLECAAKDGIEKELGLLGKNIIFKNLKEDEEKLKEKYLCIKKVEFQLSFPNNLNVNVIKREPKIKLTIIDEKNASHSAQFSVFMQKSSSESANIVFIRGASYIADNEGVIFAKDSTVQNLPEIYFPDNLKLGKTGEDKVKFLIKILDDVNRFGILFQRGIIYENNLIIDAQPKIVFDLDGEIVHQLASLQLILEKAKIDSESIEFIDLRFDKPVVKYGQGQNNLRN